MKLKIALVLCAAVIASPAMAADFLTFTVSGTGTRTIIQGSNFSTGQATGIAQYVVPLTETGGSGVLFSNLYSYVSNSIPGGQTSAIVANGSIILSESGFFIPGVVSSFGAALCFTSPVSAFTGAVGNTASTGCGFRWNINTAPVAEQFAGTINSIVVTEGFGRASSTGLVNFSSSAIAAAVPEPATWAMMMVGFGMIGATARYRRRKVTAAFA